MLRLQTSLLAGAQVTRDSNLAVIRDAADSCVDAANQLVSTLPASMAALTNLVHLNLDKNLLTGSVPAALFDSWTLIVNLVLVRPAQHGLQTNTRHAKAQQSHLQAWIQQAASAGLYVI